MTAPQPLLSIDDLEVNFHMQRGVVRAIDRIRLEVAPGEAVGIVGESGSGKSVTALALLRLLMIPGRIAGGTIKFAGRDLLALSEAGMREVRRSEIAMIFQDASNFMNPILTIGEQIADGLSGRGFSANEIRNRVIEALRAVRIPDPERVAQSYPFELSGGMQQRAVIAAAVIRQPKLIVADEPTTALDATVQYQILKLLVDLKTELNTALILISHDLSVIAGVCRRIYVMYAGQIVETGNTEDIYRNPAHPYTQALLGAILDPLRDTDVLSVLPGSIPDLLVPPSGCRFHPRCPKAFGKCRSDEPPSFGLQSSQAAKCWLYEAEAP